MGRQQVIRRVLLGLLLAAFLGFTSCDTTAILDAIMGLAARDELGPIQEVSIASAGDSFGMGDPATGNPAVVNESFSESFSMSKYEITNAQFQQFMDDGGYTTQSYWTSNGWTLRTGGGWTQPASWADSNYKDPKQPVTGVSWYEAVAFCNWRSAKEHLAPAYDTTGKADLKASGYRLPTEAEWEYAAAKGAPGQSERNFAWGNSGDGSKAVVMAMYPAAVGSKSAAGGDTPQGLADMSGNAAEWCSDNFDTMIAIQPASDYYYYIDDRFGMGGRAAPTRGGSFSDATVDPNLRCAYRNGAPLEARGPGTYNIGFRTVRR